jgi:hypothetical protein
MTDDHDEQTTGLSETELEMLALERLWWRYSAMKERRVRELFDWSITRYYQRLNTLLDRPDVLAHDPVLVRRLRRLRAERQRSRSARRFGTDL